MDHEYFMRLALKEARAAEAAGDVPAGCVIVKPAEGAGPREGAIIGKAHNQVELLKDPTAHAEMLAITQAAAALGMPRLEGTVMYVTKEPCSMCAGAIVLARIPTVVFGVSDPQRGGACSVFNILDNAKLNHRCELVQGVLEEECRTILQEFFRALRRPAQ